MIVSLLLAAALAGTNVHIYEVAPNGSVLSEREGQLVQADYVEGDLIVAYIPEEIFANGFD
mgnify:FL=1